MVGGPERCYNDAEEFCQSELPWLMETATRASTKRGLQGYEEDIAQEVFRKVKAIPDASWATKLNKKAYVARVVLNEANDLCNTDHHYEPLTDNILSSTAPEAMNAALLISELYDKLSQAEQTLFEYMFEGFSGAEMAERLGVTAVTARKRVSRLMEKLKVFTQGKEESVQLGARRHAKPIIKCSN